jgi:hypothetical protein
MISLCSVRVTAFRKFDDKTTVGEAVLSGFLWRIDEEVYLITNWHNVTGLNPDSGETIGTFTPTHFSCGYRAGSLDEGVSATGSIDIPLYNKDNSPIWIEHPKGRLVDVVAIPFHDELPATYDFYALNERDFEAHWLPNIGGDAFIVGYPEGFSGPMKTPVWKRGSIATEPNLDHEEKPMFLLDTIGNEGLSGSAVIGRASGILRAPSDKGRLGGNSKIGTWENFIGIYSGRVSRDGIGSQLGRVWKASVIEDIFSQ